MFPLARRENCLVGLQYLSLKKKKQEEEHMGAKVSSIDMGAKTEGGKAEGGKKPTDRGGDKKAEAKPPVSVVNIYIKPTDGGGDKKDDAKRPVSVVNIHINCEGYAEKDERVVKHKDGVDGAKVDTARNKPAVTRKVDPAGVTSRFDEKSHKSTEEKKANGKKHPKVRTGVLKIMAYCFCNGCIAAIKKIISERKGVTNLSVDKAQELVTVTGTMDVEDLARWLQEELKRKVEVVPSKKEEKQKEKEKDGGGEKNAEKKEGKAKAEKKEGDGGKKKAAARKA